MKKDFIVNVNDLAKPLSREGLGKLFILDNEHDLEYTELVGLKGLPVEIEETSNLYKMVAKIFLGKEEPESIVIYGDTTILDAETAKTSLDKLIDEQKSDWFFLLSTSNDDSLVKALAKFAEENDKMYFATTQSIATGQALKEIENTAIGYHNDVDDFLAEGLAKKMALALPGSITAKFQSVDGSEPSNISLIELKELHANNALTYIRSKGVNYVSEGKTTSGSYIDITLGKYFIKFNLEEALFMLAINNGKIPYSDKGIAMMVAEVENVLKTATRQGIILEQDGKGVYEITALRRNEISKIEVSNRVYNGISVKAVVAGAIHNSEINIDLVLSEEE